MTIENIQKKRFLETIYKMYYSLGSEPSSQEISNMFGKYFSRYPAGRPLEVPYSDLGSSLLIDVDIINKVVAHTALNIDVLYESFFEEVEDLYSLVTAFQTRISSLKSRRAELEKLVDDQLFSIMNTNGYYFAVTEAFNNLDLTDLSRTNAYIDTDYRKLSIPKITSGLFNYVGNILNLVGNAEVEIFLDGRQVVAPKSVDFSNAFDGLTNSEWSETFRSNRMGVCTLRINVPLSSPVVRTSGISLVEGRLNSKKPVETSLIITNLRNPEKSLAFVKQSVGDYDNFSFSFDAQVPSSLELFLTKVEPDYVTNSANQKMYTYDFRIDELIITAPYYDSFATYVSKPITLPDNQNQNLAIDEVVFDAVEQGSSGGLVQYYIAEDKPSFVSEDQFSWVPISSVSSKNPSNPSSVKFGGTKLVTSKAVPSLDDSIESSQDEMIVIPRQEQYGNPIPDYFYRDDPQRNGFNLYRFARFSKGNVPYETVILEGVDGGQIEVQNVVGTGLDRESWDGVLSGSRSDLRPFVSYNSVSPSQEFYTAQNVSYGSILLSTNVFLQEKLTITKNFLKSISAQYWNVNVFLNGVDLTSSSSLSAGVLSAPLTWNFSKGPNNIKIIINKQIDDTRNVASSFNGSISLMEGLSLTSLPNAVVYRNFLTEVKVEDLRNRYSNEDNVFSIIDWENNKEIVYRRTREIANGSRVRYYINEENNVSSIRVKIDLIRGANAYSAPVVSSYTLKFKH